MHSFFEPQQPEGPKTKGLYGILNLTAETPMESLPQHAKALCEGGISMVQIRAKDGTPQAIQRASQALVPSWRSTTSPS